MPVTEEKNKQAVQQQAPEQKHKPVGEAHIQPEKELKIPRWLIKTCEFTKDKANQFWQWAKVKPQTAMLGQFLYNLGFWGEYTALRVVRGVKSVLLNAQNRTWAVLKALGGYVQRAINTCWRELSEPFRRFYNGIKNIAALVKEEKEKESGAHAAKEGIAYFGRGVKLYAPLIKNAMAYVFPVLALGVFIYTVNTVLNYNYTLAVEVGGKIVGFVENEQIFDDATAEIAQRIKPVNGEKLDWKVEPSYTVAISSTTMSTNTMADSILRASSDEIVDATALYVNGEIIGVTTEGEQLEKAIDDMKAPYEDPGNPNLRVEFTKDLAIDTGIYSAKNLSSAEDILAVLNGEEQGQLNYEVQKGDTPSGIASKNGLSTQQLADMNPQQDILRNLHVGDNLIIQKAMPYLEVRRVETRTEQEEISFAVREEESNDLAFGRTKTVQQGEKGLDEVVREYVYYGNSSTPSEVYEIQRTTLKEPVPKIIQRGKKLQNGDVAQFGSGYLMWPVPGYRYVSRWMSAYHKGADICAPYGTPIYAADSGVVVTATYHYSYGNYVVIDHGNGTKTLYAHASRLAVGYGQAVKQGQIIAYIGSTGNSTGNHCHFEIHQNGMRVNPRNLFPGK